MADHISGKGKRYEIRQDVVGNTYVLWSFDSEADAQAIVKENPGKGYYVSDSKGGAKLAKAKTDDDSVDEAILTELENVYGTYWSKTAKLLNQTHISMGLQNKLMMNIEDAHDALIGQIE